MKKISILVSLVALFAISSITVNAQVTATASTSATIITPIAIEKTVDMNFGNVAVSPDDAGTVVLSTEGTRSKTGGVTLPVTTGTFTSAEFNVTGETDATYSISLPAAEISLSNGTETMTVGNFISSPTTTGVLTGGAQTITVGATLNVAAGQASGIYTNDSDLFVTVNYN